MYDQTFFYTIQELKKAGLNKHQVSKRLEVSYSTVYRYWTMSEEEYNKSFERVHQPKGKSKCDKYKRELLLALEDFPEFSTAQLYDQLESRYGPELDISERTLRYYVKKLREEYDLPKERRKRDYVAVRETEPGLQAQVDFGETTVRLKEDKSRRKKLYFFAISLSHSRYKYVYWLERPFTTRDVIEAHEKAFEYFRGQPREIVYDQDSTIVVEENRGEIIYTREFASYLQMRTFKPYICHAADPETKGKIENVVKYVKHNFAYGRLYEGIESWNNECYAWLERRANGKEHQTTKKVPAEVFSEERKHLLPVESKPFYFDDPIIPYVVQKDNTIHYRSNRYELPKGTYNKTKQVGVELVGNEIMITDLKSQGIIQIHTVSEGKGELITIPENERHELSPHAEKLGKEVIELLGKSKEAKQLVREISKNFPRFASDQFSGIIETIYEYDKQEKILIPALKKCCETKSETNLNFKSFARHYAAQAGYETQDPNRFKPEKTLSEYRREERLKEQRRKEEEELKNYSIEEEVYESLRERIRLFEESKEENSNQETTEDPFDPYRLD